MNKAITGFFVLCCSLTFFFACGGSGGGSQSVVKKYFSANAGGTVGYSLWVTDGTTDGTKLVKDIDETSLSNGPYAFTSMGGKTYFSATDGLTGYELWVTDGTDTGTHIVKNIDGGSGHGVADAGTGYWAVMNGRLYFSANDGTSGCELWVSDGTESGTVRVKDINTGGDSDPFELTVMNGKLYFYANDGTNGAELWVSDGTEGGTRMLTNINTSGSSSPGEFTPIGSKLYFRAYDGGAAYGCALWVYDADTDTTSPVKDPNTTVNGLTWDPINHLVAMNGLLYFVGENTTGNSEVWISEGTEETTDIMTEIRVGISGSAPWEPMAIDGKLYFCAKSGDAMGQELWISDGTAPGTYGIDIADDPATDSSYPQYFTGYNGLVYFMAEDSSGKYELWVTGGTKETTHVVKILNAVNGSSPEQLTVINGKLVFVAYTEEEGSEVWVTDGTEEGTTILKDINPGTANGDPYIE